MNWDKMYPSVGWVVLQIVLLILGLIPGIIFFIWRLVVAGK